MLWTGSALFFLLSLLPLYGSQTISLSWPKRMGLLMLAVLAQAAALGMILVTLFALPLFNSNWIWALLAGIVMVDAICLHLSRSKQISGKLLSFMESIPFPASHFFAQSEEEDHLGKLLESDPSLQGQDRREVVENALDLNETTLDEICTHRSDMICLSLKDDPAKWRQIILDNRHTFYPITNESEDDIVGVLDTRDYFRLTGVSKKAILEQTVDQPFFVAENTSAEELLRKMKQRRTYLAIVLDEYGGVTGLVTLHDIVEELFGDMLEEDQKKQADIVLLPKGVWRINGEADLEDVSKALGMKLELDDFETFSGYILGSLGYIPEDGSQLEAQIGPLNIQIRKIAGHRIRQTLVRLQPDPQ